MSKDKLKLVAVEIFLFIFQIAFSKLQFGNVFSFGIAFAFSRIFWGHNLMIVSLEYVVANLFFYNSFYQMVSVGFEIVILTLYFYFKENFRIKKKYLFLILFLCLSMMLKLYFTVSKVFLWRDYLIECALKVFALLFFLGLRHNFQKKFIFFKCGTLDYLFFSSFIVLFLLGVFEYKFMATNLSLYFFAVTVLISIRILSMDKALIFSITEILSFGYILNSSKFVVLALLATILVVTVAKLYKYLFVSIAMFVVFAVLRLSGNLTIFNAVSFGCTFLTIICIPQKIISKLSGYFDEKKINLIGENLWVEKEKSIKSKLLLMSKTLKTMRDDFKFLIVGKINRKMASVELAKDVIKRCCGNCENFKICQNSIIDKEKLVSEYVLYSIQKRQIFVEEVSVGFKTYCNKVGLVVKEINDIAKKYLDFEISVKTEDESKLIISSEFESFARLFEGFAKNIENSPQINKNLSFVAKEMLTNYMIEVVDLAIFESRLGIDRIDVIVSNETVTRNELTIALSKIVKTKMSVNKMKHLELSGLSLVSFVVSNTLKAEFAFSSKAKENINGDNAIVTKIDNNRYFLAIADGMGHGKNADRTSKMVLELVKNLFIAGIEMDLIVESINKLLLPSGLDNFSTLDACVVDLNLATCTFIKLGSSVSLIKHRQTTEVIASESLPVGIVQNLKPTIVTRKIFAEDTIFLASDGVVDSFGDIERYKIFINDAKISNLQVFTDNVLFEVQLQQKSHADDMSLIALKLLKNF